MASSSFGDDMHAEDEDTNLLERTVADLVGKDAACLVVSGTMANQLAVAAHLVPWGRLPATVVADARSHLWTWEAGGVAFLSGATVIPVVPSTASDSVRWSHLDAQEVSRALIRDEVDTHVAPTRLVCLENTLDGTIHPLPSIRRIRELTSSTTLPRTTSHPFPHMPLHLDGARLWNAAVTVSSREMNVGKGHRANIVGSGARMEKLKGAMRDYGVLVDSVGLCFSKGLGAPIGSVLAGSEEFISRARRLRKVMGGSWRQSGPLAAACLHALTHNLPDLHFDHFAAASMTAQLASLDNLVRIAAPTETNMVWVDLGLLLSAANKLAGVASTGVGGAVVERKAVTVDSLVEHLWETKKIKVGTGYGDKGEVVRLVVHKQNRESVGDLVEGFKEWAEKVVR
ncbi:Threonine aldolase [Gonapodya sp. JEL0774]|nr:Threonine aldolase [Gonapodya sp. JEL0774]